MLNDEYQQWVSNRMKQFDVNLTEEEKSKDLSIFLKGALALEEELNQIDHDLDQLKEQQEKLLSRIQESDSEEEMIEINRIKSIFSKQLEILHKRGEDASAKISAYSKKQQKDIEADRFKGSVKLLEDIDASSWCIDRINNEIQEIKNGETAELKHIQREINKIREVIDSVHCLEQKEKEENSITLKNMDVSAYLESPDLKAVAGACHLFKNSPTNGHLNSLIDTIKREINRESNALFLAEIEKIGIIYREVSDAISAARKQPPSSEQIKTALIADYDRYISEHTRDKENLAMAASTAWKHAASFFRKGAQSNPMELPDDLSVIAALKSVLICDSKAHRSLGVIARFIKSPSKDTVNTEVTRLIEKTREINKQIELIYTIEKETPAHADTTKPDTISNDSMSVTLEFKQRLQNVILQDNLEEETKNDQTIVNRPFEDKENIEC